MFLLTTIYTAAQTAKLEDEIQTLYRVISYSLPLVSALAIAVLAVFYRIQGNVRQNTRTIGQIAKNSNGQLSELQAKVDAMHRRLDTMNTAEGYKRHASTENTGTASGGTDSTTT